MEQRPRSTPGRTRDRAWDVALGLVPFVLLGGFVCGAGALVGPAAVVGIGLSCVPYLVLGAGAIAIALSKAKRERVLWMLLPTLLIAGIHIYIIIAHHMHASAQTLPQTAGGSLPPISLAKNTNILLMVYGSFFSLVTACWTTIVCSVILLPDKTNAPTQHMLCHECGYDRSGLPEDVVCPECGGKQ